MKQYIRSRIFMFIEVVIVIATLLFVNKETYSISSLSVATNTNYGKSVDVSVMQNVQKELYSQGIDNPIYSFVGELTGYAGDCPLCSGYLACPPRTNVLKEGIYYNDKIVASSKKYPCGTIIRFNVGKLSDEPITAIVLDRGVGGNVIDLLVENEDFARKKVGRVRNLNIDVLREGWTK